MSKDIYADANPLVMPGLDQYPNNPGTFGTPFKLLVDGKQLAICHMGLRFDSYAGWCGHYCSYCLDGETNINMIDGTIKKLKDIKIGDWILGVEQRKIKNILSWVVIPTEVKAHWNTKKKLVKITLSNGIELRCSGDHRWLTTRGWRYTASITNKRLNLKVGQVLVGHGVNINPFEITDDYKKGYLCGIINGDGSTGSYADKRRNGAETPMFILRMKDKIAIDRSKAYLNDFGVDTNDMAYDDMFGIITRKKENYKTILEIKNNLRVEPEFLKGYLAGFYDAEGSNRNSTGSCTFFNTDRTLLDHARLALKTFNFEFSDEKEKEGTNKPVYNFRINGGYREELRFAQLVNPIVTRKQLTQDYKLKRFSGLDIISIEETDELIEMFDITTGTENFIANGIVSHNCYARGQNMRYHRWPLEDIKIADIDEVKKDFAILDKPPVQFPPNILAGAIQHRYPIRMGTQTDCFQIAEQKYRISHRFIEEIMNHYDYPYVICTKNKLVCAPEYMKLYEGRDNVAFQFTLATLDQNYLNKVERGASTAQERLNTMKTLADAGYQVICRISPYIPEYMNDLPQLVTALAQHGCKHVVSELLRISPIMNKIMIKECNYDVIELYKSKGVKMNTGYYRYPLTEKIKMQKELAQMCTDVGMTFATCADEDPSFHTTTNCCGVEKLKKFTGCPMTTYDTAFTIAKEKGSISFDELIEERWCPDAITLREVWNSGYYENILMNFKFDKITKRYNFVEVNDTLAKVNAIKQNEEQPTLF